jgi:hypothetical protein
MKAIIGGKLFDTDTALLVASDRYHDGHNWERHGRNTHLYRTKRGSFFLKHTTCWQGERDSIEPVVKEEAMRHYESLPEHEMEYAEAFGVSPQEA